MATIDDRAFPAIVTSLQAYRTQLLRQRDNGPFNMSVYRAIDENWFAIMAMRDALNDYSPDLSSITSKGSL